MKIEKMWSKQDIVSNLKKAAKLSGMEHLKQLAEYIQQELELVNLKDTLTIEHYEIKLQDGKYQLLLKQSVYDSEKNIWEVTSSKIIEEIPLEAVEKIIL